MATFGPPITLKDHERFRNRVRYVGIELEGAWIKLPRDGAAIQRDGSLDPYKEQLDAAGISCHVGEIASPILRPADLDSWIVDHYPQMCEHPKCGLHVTMSFGNPLTYSRLMDKRYPATIVAYMTEWARKESLPAEHPLWPRLRGENIYCQHTFDAPLQIRNISKDFERTRPGGRYTVINYCYGVRGALECRLLCMFDTPERAIRAVHEVIRVTNKFLTTTAARENKLQATVQDEPEILSERRIYI